MKEISERILFLIMAIILLLSACTSVDSGETENVTAKKTLLTMAVVGNYEYATALVVGFNNQSEKYEITAKNYTSSEEYNLEQAKMRLNTEIGSGNIPDLILFDELSPYTFISRGYLMDMLPLLDADEDITEDDISIFDALTQEGGLYFLSDSFGISTGIAKYSDFGDRYGWSLDEYLEIEKSRPDDAETINNMTYEIFLKYYIAKYVADSIDWNNTTCNLNNDTFIALLESGTKIKHTPAKTNPQQVDFTPGAIRVAQGALVMSVTYCHNPAVLAYEEFMAGEKLSFIGRPTIDGSNGSDIELIPIGICTYTENQEGCWEFMKYLLTSFDDDFGLAMYRPLLMEQIEYAKKEVITQTYGDGVLMTDENVERFLDFLADIKHLRINDDAVMSIVNEEAMAYFDGKQTVEKAAELIQSRVQLYVSEQS